MAPLERVFDVLEYIADHGNVRVAEICRDLKLPRPTVHRLLSALTERGYVQHEAAQHIYRSGPALEQLATRTSSSYLIRSAEPALVGLREATGETTNLGVVSGGRIVYASTIEGYRLPRMSVAVGEDVPPHATAVGKAILAYLSENGRTRYLGPEPYSSYTERTITARHALDNELETTVGRGWAVDNEEINADAVCIAAPVFDPTGRPVAAISLSATTSRLPDTARQEIAQLVLKWTAHVSSSLANANRSEPS